MTSGAVKTPPADYNTNQSPRSLNNRRFAKSQGWRLDRDFQQYRDSRGYLIAPGAEPPDNDTDCWR